ncbi:MAG: AAC(3) family N-acetyltransferase [Lentisphaerae bacterium]|nr:AAC(3) family N-acetyltransferase [Lentisphaerota bacterium]
MSKTTHNYASLLKDLRALGIKPEDTLLVHSSMKSIGEVENGADCVLDVLSDYLKDRGLLVFPTLTSSNVNAEKPEFSLLHTVSQVGLLPELFRQRKCVYRSLHPTHSVAALGKEAEEFVAGHENFDSPAAYDSPWHRLWQRKAKTMFIGCSIKCNTFLHGVEEWAQAEEVLSIEKQQLYIVDANGKRSLRPSRRHTGKHSRYYGKVEPHFEKIGALQRGRFGDAETIVLDNDGCAQYVCKLLKKYPAAFTEKWNNDKPGFFAECLAEL